MRVAVFGAKGLLGSAIVQEFSQGGDGRTAHEVFPLDRAAVDITDPEAVASAVDRVEPELIINCAAYNAVDAAEDHPQEALRVNAFAVRTLARAARRRGAAIVHYGSDFVFDGAAQRPYTEEDRPNPRSVYASSKMLGEWFALDAPRPYVLRVESLFGRFVAGRPDKGSVVGIVRGLQAGTVPKVFIDRTVSPTYAPDAARATRELIERPAPTGLYHCVSTGHCTWLEFAFELARLLQMEPRFERVRLADVKLPAERPLYCALSNAKLAAAGVTMPTWQDALSRYVEELQRSTGQRG
jgi:dTDP-4-dehydrorhamnose reductase